jgi:hypothetical protein
MTVAANPFASHWERPGGGRLRLRAPATLDSIALHLGACRRASLYLANAGVITRVEHKRIVRTLLGYEQALLRQHAAAHGGTP